MSFLANQMSRPYLPVVVEGLVGTGPGLASAIALVMGTAALVGGLIAPLGGVLGDRIGFRPVLVGGPRRRRCGPRRSCRSSRASPRWLAWRWSSRPPRRPSVRWSSACSRREVPPERRSATLNLVYLPLYAAGIIGPALGAVVVSVGGLPAPFLLGAAVFVVGAVVIAARRGAASQPAVA